MCRARSEKIELIYLRFNLAQIGVNIFKTIDELCGRSNA